MKIRRIIATVGIVLIVIIIAHGMHWYVQKEIYPIQILPNEWRNVLFHSKNNEYNGYLSANGIFYYTKHFQGPIQIGEFNVYTSILTTNDSTKVQMYNTFLDTEKIKHIIMNGKYMEGGKTRKWIKTDETSLVVKSDSGEDEYECNCKTYILGIPLNPPLGLLNTPSGEKIIIEKMIKKNSHSDDFIKCHYDKNLYNKLNKQFDTLVEQLINVNIGGDLKMDNILFNEDGSFILTDFSTPFNFNGRCPSWDERLKEKGMEQVTDFKLFIAPVQTQQVSSGMDANTIAES